MSWILFLAAILSEISEKQYKDEKNLTFKVLNKQPAFKIAEIDFFIKSNLSNASKKLFLYIITDFYEKNLK